MSISTAVQEGVLDSLSYFSDSAENQLLVKDRPFATIRILHDSVVSLVCLVASKIFKSVCIFFGFYESFRYFHYCELYYSSRLNRFFFYLMHKNDLVNFAINIGEYKPEFAKGKLDHYQAAQKSYKPLLDDYMQKAKEQGSSFNEDSFRFQDQGICFGESISYISEYLQLSSQGLSEEQALLKASLSHSEFGTDEAAVLQMLYTAHPENANLNRKYGTAIRNIEYQMKYELLISNKVAKRNLELLATTYQSAPESLSEKRLEQIETSLKRSHKQIRHSTCQKVNQVRLDYSNQTEPRIIDLKDIESRFHSIIVDETTKNPTKSMQNEIHELEPGTYLLGIMTGTMFQCKLAHATTVIKHSNGDVYFFDPNFGTLKYNSDEAGKHIYEHIAKFYKGQYDQSFIRLNRISEKQA